MGTSTHTQTKVFRRGKKQTHDTLHVYSARLMQETQYTSPTNDTVPNFDTNVNGTSQKRFLA